MLDISFSEKNNTARLLELILSQRVKILALKIERCSKLKKNNQWSNSKCIRLNTKTQITWKINAIHLLHNLIFPDLSSDPFICCLKKIHLIVKVRHYLKLKGQKQTFQENGVRTQEEMSVHIPAKMQLKP